MMVQRVKSLSESLTDWFNLTLRSGLSLKITLPYVLLAVVVAIAGAYIITQYIVDSVQERFVNQLLAVSRLAADRVVEIEQESLATLRTVAHTEGVSQALLDGDIEAIRQLVYPVAVNDRADVVELLDLNATALLSLRHRRDGSVADYEAVQGTDLYAAWPFVQRVLAGEVDEIGDKFAGLVTDAPWGSTFYIAGPIFHEEDGLAGVILVGCYLDQMVNDLRASSGAEHITIYASDGQALGTTFLAETGFVPPITPESYAEVLEAQQENVPVSEFEIDDERYSQAFLPFEARHGADMAVLSATLPHGYWVQPGRVTRSQMTLWVACALLLVIATGTWVAQRIARPVLTIAQASRRVAQGDLDQQVEVNTRDEVGELAEAFNEMVSQLRLGEAVKDIFGRAVSPEVSAALIQAVSSGQVALGGETRLVTILFSDIRSFTTFSERHSASQVVSMLNEFFGAIYPAIADHGGVINKFGGDSTLALFGAPIPHADHARRAVLTALGMSEAVAGMNERRGARGQVPIHIGVGINTGEVVVGIVGAAERLEYTAIGDSVNVASRIEGLTRRFKDHDVLISQETLDSLGSDHGFIIQDLGAFAVKGKSSDVHIYSVRGVERDA
jgi:adenylate cyclase